MWLASRAVPMALAACVRSPGRSVLTMVGLAIGVAAFIAMLGFGTGATRAVVAQFESLGTNVLRVKSSAGIRAGKPVPPEPLTESDVAALRRDVGELARVVPVSRAWMSARHAGTSTRTSVQGTTPELAVVQNRPLATGRMFDEIDVRSGARVCVLGAAPARELYAGAEPLGTTLLVADSLPCRVIGVLADKGRSVAGDDLDQLVLLPVTTFDAYLGSGRGYDVIYGQTTHPELLASATRHADTVLRRTHGVSSNDTPDFYIGSPDDATRAARRTSAILERLLAGIAAISLLVGGIGIMNIQLVAVAERTREIGTRAAIGASPGQILGQFLIEASVLAWVMARLL